MLASPCGEMRRLLAAIIDKYLADPLINVAAGAAVASQAAPELTKSTSH